MSDQTDTEHQGAPEGARQDRVAGDGLAAMLMLALTVLFIVFVISRLV